jgi:hypothetical protein
VVNITNTNAQDAMEAAITDAFGAGNHIAKSNTYKNATPNTYTIAITVTNGNVIYTEALPGVTVPES